MPRAVSSTKRIYLYIAQPSDSCSPQYNDIRYETITLVLHGEMCAGTVKARERNAACRSPCVMMKSRQRLGAIYRYTNRPRYNNFATNTNIILAQSGVISIYRKARDAWIDWGASRILSLMRTKFWRHSYIVYLWRYIDILSIPK